MMFKKQRSEIESFWSLLGSAADTGRTRTEGAAVFLVGRNRYVPMLSGLVTK